MGMDIACECGMFSFKLGSYQSVAMIRTKWVEAELLRLNLTKNSIFSKKGDINLSKIKKSDLFLPGSKYFVCHDNITSWSSEEAKKIHEAILVLKPFLRKTFGEDYFYEEDGCFWLEDLFQHCATHWEMVEVF